MPQSNRLYTGGQASGEAQNRRLAINTPGANNASLPCLQSFTTTAETQFTDPAAANSIPLALVIPPGGPCEQESFTVVASGYIKTGNTSTVVLKLYQGDSSTIGSNNELGATTSESLASVSTPFLIECKMVYDSVSGKLDVLSFSAVVKGVVNTTIVASTPLSLSISNTANPVLAFTLTATFGTATNPNTVNLKDFGVNH